MSDFGAEDAEGNQRENLEVEKGTPPGVEMGYEVGDSALREESLLVEEPPGLPTPWSGWWTLLLAVTAVVIFNLGQVLFYLPVQKMFEGLGLAAKAGDLEEGVNLDGDVVGLVAFLVIFVVCPFCLWVAQMRPGWRGMDYLGSEKVAWWQWPLWIGVTFGVMILGGVFSQLMGEAETHESMVEMANTTDLPVLLFLGVAIGAPLTEEFIFRGLLFRGWRESPLGLWGTLVVTSALWTAMHGQYGWVQLVVLFTLGIVFGLARQRTGSVWVPVGMHFFNNGLAFLGMMYAEKLQQLGS